MSKEIEHKTKTPENEKSSEWPFLIPPPNTWHPILKTIISCFGLLVCIVIAIGIVFLLYDILSLYFSSGKDNRFSDLRTSLLILAALIGAPFLVWRTWLAAEQTKTAERQAEIARDRSYTELFTKAVEQLGSEKPAKKETKDKDGNPTTIDAFVPNIEVRIGAIFALGRIMHDSKKDAEAIVDTLAAYVRENCGEPQPFECETPEQMEGQSVGDWVKAIKTYVGQRISPQKGTLIKRAQIFRENAPANRSDIQTALTVLGRRPDYLKRDENKKPDLTSVNFQGARLAIFDFNNLNLSNAFMQGANLYDAKMQGADLAYAKMQSAYLYDAKMQGAILISAEMQGANLISAEMQGADLRSAEMQGANLISAEMQGVDLTLAKMQGADLRNAEMRGANLRSAEMQGADLTSTKMQGANLISAEMQEVQITEARKTAASVIWVDFTKTKFVPESLQPQLEEMFGHKEHTKLPDGFTPPKHWSEVDMSTEEGRNQYNQEWEAFKKKMGVE